MPDMRRSEGRVSLITNAVLGVDGGSLAKGR